MKIRIRSLNKMMKRQNVEWRASWIYADKDNTHLQPKLVFLLNVLYDYLYDYQKLKRIIRVKYIPIASLESQKLFMISVNLLWYLWIIQNEMNRALGHFCAHTGQIGPWEPPEDGDMSEMTLPSRHRMRTWRSEAEHATSRSRRLPTILSFTSGWGRNIFVISNRRDRPLTTTLEPKPIELYAFFVIIRCSHTKHLLWENKLRLRILIFIWTN